MTIGSFPRITGDQITNSPDAVAKVFNDLLTRLELNLNKPVVTNTSAVVNSTSPSSYEIIELDMVATNGKASAFVSSSSSIYNVYLVKITPTVQSEINANGGDLSDRIVSLQWKDTTGGYTAYVAWNTTTDLLKNIRVRLLVEYV